MPGLACLNPNDPESSQATAQPSNTGLEELKQLFICTAPSDGLHLLLTFGGWVFFRPFSASKIPKGLRCLFGKPGDPIRGYLIIIQTFSKKHWGGAFWNYLAS